MKNNMNIQSIGLIEKLNGQFAIRLHEPFKSGLTNINGFSHLQVIWWGNLYDSSEYRSHVVIPKPYKNGPDQIGIFATRSPVRPNPILITNILATNIDFDMGIIYTPYIDAEPGTPILDIKPYHPSERVKNTQVPRWCSHWPQWDEDTATFNWQNEFNF